MERPCPALPPVQAVRSQIDDRVRHPQDPGHVLSFPGFRRVGLSDDGERECDGLRAVMYSTAEQQGRTSHSPYLALDEVQPLALEPTEAVEEEQLEDVVP